MSITLNPQAPSFAEITLADGGAAHSTINGDEHAPIVHVMESGMFEGVWLTSRVFNVMEWAMVSNAVMLSPDEAEAVGWALVNGAAAIRKNPPKPF